MTTRQDILDAITNKNGLLRFQPICDLVRDQVVAHEALLRLWGTSLEEIEPKQFVPLAVENQIVEALDMVTLHLLRKQLRLNVQAPPVPVAINISRRSLGNLAYMSGLLQSDITPRLRHLIFELKTSDIARDPSLLRIASRLSKAGAGISVTSDPNQPFPPPPFTLGDFQYLKVNMQTYQPSQLKALAEQCKAEGIKLIAEMIEHEADFVVARRAGVSWGQGYYLGRPTQKI
jgi:EAL domain-containing protein (putative c-di-GMP-specific phosphodiesterase class I)